ncbi:amidohydrolase [Leifsonia poae]|uniref:amidohydrolase n=1 Tax=Leifsonia poae TaxID=110933 RepID=UPI001CBEF13E|nr:amidohydrolase family protein [Leifsonia poae]
MQRSNRDSPDPSAELVLRGGTVLTLDEEDTRGTAIAVRHGRILRVGSDADVQSAIGRRTRVVELGGRAVIPGINDSHLHAAWLGAMWPNTVFGETGAGDGGPARSDADPHDTSASAPLVTTHQERRDAILRAGELIASLGITSYTEPGIGPGEDGGATGCFSQSVFEAYVELESERALTARVNVLALFGVLDGPSTLHGFTSGLRALERDTTRPTWLRVAGVKIFADGIPPLRQAWTTHSYPDGSTGDLLIAGLDRQEREDNLHRMILEANRLGYQVGVHATGDRTIDATVAAVADALAESRRELRHYVIHGDLVTPQALERMAELGMGWNVQPGIAVKTAAWLGSVLGESVAAAAWPLEAAARAGVSVSLSSDAPILAPDWRVGIADADAWMGPVPAGAREQRMLALLRGYTTAPARQDGAEPWKGSLEPRKAADLCVLEADPLNLTPAELPEVAIDLTVVDGEIVYERQPASQR